MRPESSRNGSHRPPRSTRGVRHPLEGARSPSGTLPDPSGSRGERHGAGARDPNLGRQRDAALEFALVSLDPQMCCEGAGRVKMG